MLTIYQKENRQLMNQLKHKKQTGFTIVELLIVIVVIGILAAITVVAYNGIQARSYDTQSKSTVAALKKSLALFHVDHGYYPAMTDLGDILGGSSDGSWALQNMVGINASTLRAPKTPSNVKNAIIRGYSASVPRDGTYMGYISQDKNGVASNTQAQAYALTWYSFVDDDLIVETVGR